MEDPAIIVLSHPTLGTAKVYRETWDGAPAGDGWDKASATAAGWQEPAAPKSDPPPAE